jgi:hypothetical protein
VQGKVMLKMRTELRRMLLQSSDVLKEADGDIFARSA